MAQGSCGPVAFGRSVGVLVLALPEPRGPPCAHLSPARRVGSEWGKSSASLPLEGWLFRAKERGDQAPDRGAGDVELSNGAQVRDTGSIRRTGFECWDWGRAMQDMGQSPRGGRTCGLQG